MVPETLGFQFNAALYYTPVWIYLSDFQWLRAWGERKMLFLNKNGGILSPKLSHSLSLETSGGENRKWVVDGREEALPTPQPRWKNILILFDLWNFPNFCVPSSKCLWIIREPCWCGNLLHQKCYNIPEKLLMAWASFIWTYKNATSELLWVKQNNCPVCKFTYIEITYQCG